jgi:sigma-B regulation protein RsbU (phosphoserine phosphatase)
VIGSSGQLEPRSLAGPIEDGLVTRASGLLRELFADGGLEAAYGIVRKERPVAVLGLGPRHDRQPYGEDEVAFLAALAACAGAPLEGARAAAELRRLNRRLSATVFELRNVLEVSRELVASLDEDEIHSLLTATLMGHLMVSRAALFLDGVGGLAAVHERGVRWARRGFPPDESAAVLAAMHGAQPVESLPAGPVREELEGARLVLLVPLLSTAGARGFVALGERASGRPFSDEDHEFAQTLAGQAQAALESVHLHRVRAVKERQDRELQIAREIQQSLFPRGWPALPGFEVAALSLPCHEVGGDHYDVVPLSDGRVALTVADVSGKGTPAAILMASVHASLRALAGSAAPAELMDRVNRFLFESTQTNRYVTLVYAELDPVARTLRYVNAGHVPPCLARVDGRVESLETGGPVLGLLEDAAYEVGEVSLFPGDILALVTDGVTEALSPDERELGQEGFQAALCARRAERAAAALGGLLSVVESWTGPAGCADDLTALVLKCSEPA